MRIAYVLADRGIPLFGNKGASVHVREFVRALGTEHTVDLFCVALGLGRYDLPVRQLYVVPGSEYVGTCAASPDGDEQRLDACERMAQVLGGAQQANAYDLIYERYSLFSDVGTRVGAGHGVPVALEVNAPLIVEREQQGPFSLRGVAEAAEACSFQGADVVVTVSEEVAGYVRGIGASPDRVHVAPNAVDTARFHPRVDGTRVRSDLGISDDFVIGFTGSLKKWHGVDVLISAWLEAAEPGWSLLIVGEGPEWPKLATHAGTPGHHGRIVFTGAVSHYEMPEYVAAMDVAVAPYRSVPDFYFSPLKLFEYLAAGKAVVASEIGQIPSVVRHGGNGLLVPPDDVAALRAALSLLAKDRDLRMGLARRAPHGLVSWEETARGTVAIAQDLTKRRVKA